MQRQFIAIRQALEEHLTAINENTSEIQAMFDYLQELDKKIEKIDERLNKIDITKEKIIPKIQSLNETEKKIFLILYTENNPLNYNEIAQRAKVPYSIVPDAISSLHKKGIPFIRSFCNNKLFLKVTPYFKEIQAKENIINLSLNSYIH